MYEVFSPIQIRINRFLAASLETHAHTKRDSGNGKLLMQNDFDAMLFQEFHCQPRWLPFSNVVTTVE